MVELPVVLGIKPGQHPQVAAFAVAEALRRQTSLRVVHAGDDLPVSRALFDDVRQVVAARGDAVDVDFVVIDGDPAETLLDEAHLASTVVLGADDGPWAARALGTEIAHAVATHADAPVIVVPRTVPGGRLRSCVVAALDFGGEVDAELAYALETADRQHEPLHVIYAAGPTSDYPTRRNRWYHLEDTIDRWRPRYPGVQIQTAVEPGNPVHTCVIASAGASLLVVGQPAAEHPRLASRTVVARLLRRSSAPVAVVPVGYARMGTPA
ncbi:MAG: universal stress protein [Aeromicrobium sp.]